MSNIINKLTKEEKHRLLEYSRCKKDPVYFMENYIQLAEVGGDKNPTLYEPQKKFVNILENHHYAIALKSRQIGISTITQMYCAWVMTFFNNVVIGVVSRKSDEASDFSRKTKNMIDKLPDWMRPKFTTDNVSSYITDTGCQFYSAAVNEKNPDDLFRGKAITILIIDEAAFIRNIDKAYTGCAPALSKSQKSARKNDVPYATVIISTPNKTVGTGQWYYQKWTNAVNQFDNEDDIGLDNMDKIEAGNFYPVKIHWSEVDEFAEDPDWYKTQCNMLDNIQWKIDQELEMKFVASSDSFFDPSTISYLNERKANAIRKVRLKHNKLLHQFVHYNPKDFVLIGIDTASSHGSDYSTIQVLDFISMKQIAEFREKMRVDDFCDVVEKVCRLFPNHLLIPENNSYGNQLCEYLTKKGLNFNIYRSKVTSARTQNPKLRYGIYTNPQNRPLIIDALYSTILENPEVVYSERTALELIGLTEKNGKIEADTGNDDLAMAFAFCCYVRQYDPPLGLINNSENRHMFDDMDNIVSWNDAVGNIHALSPEKLEMRQTVENVEDVYEANEVANRLVRTHLHKNLLHELDNSGSNVIDIMKMIGKKSD